MSLAAGEDITGGGGGGGPAWPGPPGAGAAGISLGFIFRLVRPEGSGRGFQRSWKLTKPLSVVMMG